MTAAGHGSETGASVRDYRRTEYESRSDIAYDRVAP